MKLLAPAQGRHQTATTHVQRTEHCLGLGGSVGFFDDAVVCNRQSDGVTGAIVDVDVHLAGGINDDGGTANVAAAAGCRLKNQDAAVDGRLPRISVATVGQYE